jgi:hypothetical protein
VRGLGRWYDIGAGVVPVDMNAGDGATGARINMMGSESVDVIVFLGAAASGTDDVTIDVQQHTAYVSGTSADLDAAAVSTSSGITEWFVKSETTLDNDEVWARVTQSAASEITLTGATYAARQCIVAFNVRAAQLGTDYTHMSVTLSYATNAVRTGAVLYLPVGLRYANRPDRFGIPNLLRPGAANA